ncbi:hypothetical protein [Phosphitispora sp. TUW77]|uniref:prenylated flavin chaperone LpdD n=1 Tax=Phosphitispora sp. TUW77 TaxID=3152361 RepID=UPI003AB66042
MNPDEVKVTYGEARYRIEISSVITTDGISITITGGEKPHVGGVALSVPRTSLGGGKVSCDTWVIPVPGHKDTEVAVPVAEMICRETRRTVSVAAGIHIDRAEEREIRILVENSLAAARLLMEQIDQLCEEQEACEDQDGRSDNEENDDA